MEREGGAVPVRAVEVEAVLGEVEEVADAEVGAAGLLGRGEGAAVDFGV